VINVKKTTKPLCKAWPCILTAQVLKKQVLKKQVLKKQVLKNAQPSDGLHNKTMPNLFRTSVREIVSSIVVLKAIRTYNTQYC